MFIYTLAFPQGNIRYVGKANNPVKRLRKHMQESKRMKNHRDKWLLSLTSTPYLAVIEEVSFETWQSRERYWISKFKHDGFNLVNGTDGGEGSNGFKGKKHSEATKLKLRERSLGKKASEETLIKLRNRRHSPSTKDKIRLARLGKKASKETIKKIRASRTKLSDEDVCSILKAVSGKSETQISIARRFGISRAYVLMLQKGQYRNNSASVVQIHLPQPS
jgi:group I intron endonuclease